MASIEPPIVFAPSRVPATSAEQRRIIVRDHHLFVDSCARQTVAPEPAARAVAGPGTEEATAPGDPQEAQDLPHAGTSGCRSWRRNGNGAAEPGFWTGPCVPGSPGRCRGAQARRRPWRRHNRHRPSPSRSRDRRSPEPHRPEPRSPHARLPRRSSPPHPAPRRACRRPPCAACSWAQAAGSPPRLPCSRPDRSGSPSRTGRAPDVFSPRQQSPDRRDWPPSHRPHDAPPGSPSSHWHGSGRHRYGQPRPWQSWHPDRPSPYAGKSAGTAPRPSAGGSASGSNDRADAHATRSR